MSEVMNVPESKTARSKAEPELRFSEFDGEWFNLVFGEIVTKISSGKSATNEVGKYPVYGSTGLISTTDNPSFEGLNILIARVGANAGLLNIAEGIYGVTDNTLVVEIDNSKNSILFVFNLLKKFNLNKLVFGSGQPLITGGQLKKLKLYFPVHEEQQKIADFLSSVDKKIEQLTEKHRLLTEYKKGVMQQIFSQQIRFKDDNGNDYPEWEVKHLGDIANITMGTSPSSSAYNEAGTGLPLIQGNADVKNRISTPRIYTSEITKECLIGDVLLSVRAPVGEVSRSLHHACIGRGMSSIRGAKLNSTEFIYQFLLWFEPRWKSISQGSTFESVNTKDIKELSVLAPCEEEQQKIANFLTEIDHKIDQAWSNLEQTKTFKKGLLQKMFV